MRAVCRRKSPAFVDTIFGRCYTFDMKLLLIEDNAQLAAALKQFFKQHNIQTTLACDGITGFDEASTGLYDLVLLDVMLPGKDGFAVLKELREDRIHTPVLMLTARSATPDKILGLTLGADDYLPKPFDLYELLARVKALARRKNYVFVDELAYEDIRLLPDSSELQRGESAIKLGDKEYALMELLLSQPGSYVNKEFMAGKLQAGDTESCYNAVEVYVSFLRKKLKALGSRLTIKNSRNVGYKLDVQD